MMRIDVGPWKIAGLLLAVTTVIATVPAAHSAGADMAFTVGSYPVDASAADAVTAKERAMADGQQAAFRSLLKRLVPVTQYKLIANLKTSVRAAELIDGVAVQSERNSSTRYIATLDFSFRPDAIRNLLRQNGIPFVDAQAPQIVVVPSFTGQDANGANGRLWSEAWRALDLKHSLTPYRVEGLKPADRPEMVTAAQSGDPAAMRAIAKSHGSDLVLLVNAETETQARKLHVTMAGQDAVGSFVLRRTYRLDTGDPGYTLELAAVVSLGILEGRWKAHKARSIRGGYAALSAAPEPVQIGVEYSGLAQWQDIRRTITETPGVEDLQVGGVSARGADIALRFPGGGDQLADALRGQGLELVNRGGMWLLRSQR